MNPVVHFEMPLKDRKRASTFYQTAFGWDMQVTGPEMGHYVLATTTPSGKDGRPESAGGINGGFYQYDPKKPGFDKPSVVVAVDNIEEKMKIVEKAGGHIDGKPMDIPGVGTFVSIIDTEGNRVGMLQPAM